MAIVTRKSSSSTTLNKKSVTKKSVQSFREANFLSELTDTNFGVLDASKDNLIVSYDFTSDKFVFISADQLLSTSVEDNDIPDDFVDVLESELDLGAIELQSIDGGSF